MIRSPASDTRGRLAKSLLLLSLLVVLPGLVHAQQSPPGWLADANGCRVWNPFPLPDEHIQWDGPCVDGFAHGRGTLRWYESGQLVATDRGEFKRGKLNGYAVLVFSNGMRFEGNFEDQLPHGQGTLRTETGEVFSGYWSYGCFRDGQRKKAFGTRPEDCEFH